MELWKAIRAPEEYELICVLPVGIPEEEFRLPRKRAFEQRAWFSGFPAEIAQK